MSRWAGLSELFSDLAGCPSRCSCFSTARTSPSDLLSDGQVRELLEQAAPTTHRTGLSKQLAPAVLPNQGPTASEPTGEENLIHSSRDEESDPDEDIDNELDRTKGLHVFSKDECVDDYEDLDYGELDAGADNADWRGSRPAGLTPTTPLSVRERGADLHRRLQCRRGCTVSTTAIPRTRIEEIDRAALQERITDNTTGHSANPELVPTRTRTVSELEGQNSEKDLGAPTLENQN
ncbi:hypothetical protein PSTG_03885 [Puccinia striiformis f. sp. tritici PST-78]|uniref:Uncharacterized protein n=1 Tax=Puccinia striiformis f. sp. tritici PST-78 TaxID=1165861 RepID=A0A0L0VUI7_9BASI|nr:hypothetical protein PSTG_03885 [Puccinia striiformis f. sp. tritici PST-78]